MQLYLIQTDREITGETESFKLRTLCVLNREFEFNFYYKIKDGKVEVV